MLKNKGHILPYLIPLLAITALLSTACSTQKNTAASRFYHNFTTRYNVYYNGINNYKTSMKSLHDQHQESYSERIMMDPISAKAHIEKKQEGGAFDQAIVKGRKAIHFHSIRTKPERKRGWQNDPKQQAFQSKREYNTFLHNAWMLIGKSQFYNADFLQAQATFSYIARLYSNEALIRDEARLWQARCFTEMGWIVEGRRVLERIPKTSPLQSRYGLYAKVSADLLLHQDSTSHAIPLLRTAAKQEKDRTQRTRMYYLLGQILQENGQNDEARQAYSKVIRSNPPFELDLAARIRRTEVDGRSNPRDLAARLLKMAKREKYKEVTDQIYFAAGNIYLSIPDSSEAIKAFDLGASKSTKRSADFALCQIRLGDIYMNKLQYIDAQPRFAAALGALSNNHKQYERISELSSQLDELVAHAQIVHDQDSMLLLAAMPEDKRLAVIDSVIAAYIKAEKEAKKNESLAMLQEQQDALNAEANILNPRQAQGLGGQAQQGIPGSTDFYFYNPQLLSQGKTAFERKWGKRILEDDWRRRRKQMSFEAPVDSLPADALPEGELTVVDEEAALQDSLMNDPKQREYYLSQLPLTDEAKELANGLIAEGLWGMGTVFNERMERFAEAIDSYEKLLQRYPKFDRRQDLLYRLFMLYSRVGKKQDAERYRRFVLQEFSNEALAKALSNPNYLQELAHQDQIQNDLYEKAFDAYLDGKVKELRSLRSELQDKYPLSELNPKFDFLHALGFVLESNGAGFTQALKDLVDKYPKADVTELAGSMLAELLRGRSIVQGGYSGINWDIHLGGDSLSINSDSLPAFIKAKAFERTRLLLLSPRGSIGKNQLLFIVASFNFKAFTRQNLELQQQEKGPFDELLMSSMPTPRLGWQYIGRAYAEDGYMQQLSPQAILFPVSESNYQLLLKGKSLSEYMAFLATEPRSAEQALVLDRWLIATGQAVAQEEGEDAEVLIQDEKATSPVQVLTPSVPSAIESTPSTKKDSIESVKPAVSQLKIAQDSIHTKPLVTELSQSDLSTTLATDSTSVVTETATQSKPVEVESLVGSDSIHVAPAIGSPKKYTPKEIKEMERQRLKEELAKKKEDEKAKRAKIKERERQQKERIKEREKARKEKLRQQAQKAKERRELQKQRERERKEKLRQREKERRERERNKRASKPNKPSPNDAPSGETN